MAGDTKAANLEDFGGGGEEAERKACVIKCFAGTVINVMDGAEVLFGNAEALGPV